MENLWSDKKRLTLFALPWTFTKYSLTEEKLLVEKGFLSKKEEEVRLYRIVDLTLERSFLQRIFGLGTVVCQTVDRTTPSLEIMNIKDPKRVKELISDTAEAERVKKRVTSRETMISDMSDCDCDHE